MHVSRPQTKQQKRFDLPIFVSNERVQKIALELVDGRADFNRVRSSAEKHPRCVRWLVIPKELDAGVFRGVKRGCETVRNTAVDIDMADPKRVRAYVGTAPEFVSGERLNFKTSLTKCGKGTKG
jgi:hypothetical protein